MEEVLQKNGKRCADSNGEIEKPLSVLPQISAEENLRLESIYKQSQIAVQLVKQKQKKQRLNNTVINSKEDDTEIEEGKLKDNDTGKEAKKDRLPKRKVALLISYCGTGYHGMQINPNAPTIELDLHKALALSKAVAADNQMAPNKVSFVRCARTDRGVHAGANLVSLKMIIEDVDIIAKINSFLPKQIRVWKFVRTRNNFHAKNECDSRIYEYLLPTYCLLPCDPSLYPYSTIAAESKIDPAEVYERRKQFDIIELEKESLESIAQKRKYRINATTLAKLREILKEFEGTKKHHNFTVGKTFKDHSAQRYIMSFSASDPFVKDNMEWISCKVHGQAFMLHQIRKMIGFAIMVKFVTIKFKVIRTNTPVSVMQYMFGETRVNIPKAPSLTLLLERPVFSHYNEKNPASVISFDQYESEILKFKDEFIYERFVREEIETVLFHHNHRDILTNGRGWLIVTLTLTRGG